MRRMRNDCIALLNQKSKNKMNSLLFSQEKQEGLKEKERRLIFRKSWQEFESINKFQYKFIDQEWVEICLMEVKRTGPTKLRLEDY